MDTLTFWDFMLRMDGGDESVYPYDQSNRYTFEYMQLNLWG